MKYKREEYLNYDPFGDDKGCGVVEMQKVKIVKTRKPHTCNMDSNGHEIPIGSYARFESCKYDGEFMRWYHCVHCIDKYFDEWEYDRETDEIIDSLKKGGGPHG